MRRFTVSEQGVAEVMPKDLTDFINELYHGLENRSLARKKL